MNEKAIGGPFQEVEVVNFADGYRTLFMAPLRTGPVREGDIVVHDGDRLLVIQSAVSRIENSDGSTRERRVLLTRPLAAISVVWHEVPRPQDYTRG